MCESLNPASSGSDRRLSWFLAQLSSRFLSLPSSQVNAAIEDTQQLIVSAFSLDRSSLWQTRDPLKGLLLTHTWQRAGFPPLPPLLDAEALLPWTHARVMHGEMVSFGRVDELPEAASVDVESYRTYGPMAVVAIPLRNDSRTFGVLSFACLSKTRVWSVREIEEFQLVAQVFGNVIARQRAELEVCQLYSEMSHAMRLAASGELAASVAHEINQPLTAILSNAQAALRFLANDPANIQDVLAILNDITRDSKRAGGIIRGLRALADETIATRELCSLNAIVQQVLEFTEPEFRVHGVRCQTVLAPCDPKVDGIAVQFQQVLVNLLLNSLQALAGKPPGEGEVQIETRTGSGEAALIVRDNGPGFRDGDVDQCFEAFRSTKAGGLGLGLTICRRIAAGHGGRIEARNRTDAAAGAEVALFLPAAEDALPT